MCEVDEMNVTIVDPWMLEFIHEPHDALSLSRSHIILLENVRTDELKRVRFIFTTVCQVEDVIHQCGRRTLRYSIVNNMSRI